MRARPNATKRRHRLGEDLFSVSDKQNTLELWTLGIKCRKPRLAKARGQDNETSRIALGTRRDERLQCTLLNVVRLGRRRVDLWRYTRLRRRRRLPVVFCPIRIDPIRIERPNLWVIQEIIERPPHRRHAFAVAGSNDPVVPFEPVFERGLGEIRTPHPGDLFTVLFAKEICLGVVARAGVRLEDEGTDAVTVLLAQVEKFEQRVGLGHVQVIAGNDPERAAAFEQVDPMRTKKLNPTLNNERNGPVGRDRSIEVRAKLREQGLGCAGR